MYGLVQFMVGCAAFLILLAGCAGLLVVLGHMLELLKEIVDDWKR